MKRKSYSKDLLIQCLYKEEEINLTMRDRERKWKIERAERKGNKKIQKDGRS
jgi:hypothetical protein